MNTNSGTIFFKLFRAIAAKIAGYFFSMVKTFPGHWCLCLHIVIMKYSIVYQIAREVGCHNCALGTRSNDTYDTSKDKSINHALSLSAFHNWPDTNTLSECKCNRDIT
jgi:hypothetical protein